MKYALAFLLLLAACESPEKKLERLRFARVVPCGTVQFPELAESAAKRLANRRGESGAPSKALVDSLQHDAALKCAVATRELDLFMAGQ